MEPASKMPDNLSESAQDGTRLQLQRRALLRTAAQAGALALMGIGSLDAVAGQPGAVNAVPKNLSVAVPVKPAVVHGPDRRLRLINGHTWEKLDVVYWSQGEYIESSLADINLLMRDHRANKSRAMDVKLLDDLHRLYISLDTSERIHVLSGYRTPETNAKLRKRSKGVAKYSLHMEGRAADIHVPGIRTRTLQKAALNLKAGGVGYYGRSGFVHIDTGRVRMWENG